MGGVIKWALIGDGGMAAKTPDPSILGTKGNPVIAICGRDKRRAGSFASWFGVPKVYTDVA